MVCTAFHLVFSWQCCWTPRTNRATPCMHCKLRAILTLCALKKSELWCRAEMISYKKSHQHKAIAKNVIVCFCKEVGQREELRRSKKKKSFIKSLNSHRKRMALQHTAHCGYFMQVVPHAHTTEKNSIMCPEMPHNVLYTLRTKLPT